MGHGTLGYAAAANRNLDYNSQIGSAMDRQSNYHMDLLEEKREEIQKIIWKRQRKAALVSIVK